MEKLTGMEFPEYIYVQGSLYLDNILHKIENSVQRWLDLHIIKIYAENLEVGDGIGTTLHVL